MFGRIFASTSADAGTVKTGRKAVGVPLMVAVSMVAAEVSTTDALRPSAELVVVCPATRVRKEDIKKAAILEDESAMLDELLDKEERFLRKHDWTRRSATMDGRSEEVNWQSKECLLTANGIDNDDGRGHIIYSIPGWSLRTAKKFQIPAGQQPKYDAFSGTTRKNSQGA